MIRFDDSPERKTEQTGIDATPTSKVSRKTAPIRVPRIVQDFVLNDVTGLAPSAEIGRQRQTFRKADTPVERHVTQRCRIRERARHGSHFPDSVIRASP